MWLLWRMGHAGMLACRALFQAERLLTVSQHSAVQRAKAGGVSSKQCEVHALTLCYSPDNSYSIRLVTSESQSAFTIHAPFTPPTVSVPLICLR